MNIPLIISHCHLFVFDLCTRARKPFANTLLYTPSINVDGMWYLAILVAKEIMTVSTVDPQLTAMFRNVGMAVHQSGHKHVTNCTSFPV